ncbi:M56 family metallopeptidase [Flavobacterium paronense]|uniref:M56 family metallopeptidase n=1 Tax=Flavobacterium paronense TaxID=1392775 RepID=A0ABV5GG51_9FLAO|nr:M56 family metallopeptidase [Flavobacterium paronense]MDN3677000.1 M56 family metallopeptidase [Flavobacterium paronense]
MESVFIYLLKSSALIAVFYLAYHFLVRKETFFNSNRWFLLSGLFTSLLLPFFFIKKIILVERPKMAMEDLVAYSQLPAKTIQDVPVVEAFDWMQFIWISYVIIACVLVIRIVFNFTSLYRMLYQQQVIKKEQFKLVNLNENIAPFSFFNYIVFNADLYSNDELQSILLHEKIHSQEKHSVDVLIAKLFCIVFWFNPFVWLYKKAITQNLEYIADQKAIEQLEDKKSYQRALLKVVSHQSCLPITNNFYQSLIKKRIVMLNKNQSHKRNSWKYALVIPALIGFVLLFQIKTIAQEKEEATNTKNVHYGDEIRVVVDKNTSESELKKEAKRLKEEHGITLKCSKVKRNSAGEITGIKLEYKDKEGNKGVSQVDGKEPIKPIQFYKNDRSIGFGNPRQVRIFNNNSNEERLIELADEDSTKVADNFDFNFDFDMEAPEALEAPEPAEAPEAVEAPEAPMFPKHFWSDSNTETKIIVKKDGEKPLVILNGKVIEGDESIISKKELDELIDSSSKDSEGDKKNIYINWNDAVKIRNKAIANAKIQLKRMQPILKKEMERAKAEMDRAKPEIERAKREIEASKPEIEKAKAEMQQAKEEMQKAKAEMDTAKAELEKARTELENQKK